MNGYICALFTSLLWGAGFVGSKYGLTELGAMWVTFARFAMALVICLPTLLWIKKPNISLKLLAQVALCSLFLTGIMFFQIKGLEYTTVAKSGFITILYVFFTPILGYLFFKTKITKTFVSLLSIAFVGILLLLDLEIANLNRGDFYTLLCALCSALHLIALSHFSKSTKNLFLFNILQLSFVSLICLPLAIYFEGFEAPLKVLSNTAEYLPSISAILFMGVFSTALAFLLQIKAQQTISANKIGLIFLLESPFAVILGFTLLGEALNSRNIAGCILVLSAVALIPFEASLKNTGKLALPKIKHYLIKGTYSILGAFK